MDELRFDRSVKALATATGRRAAMRALGTKGVALLAALGLAEAAVKGSHQGGAAEVEATTRPFRTTFVLGDASDSLPAAASSHVSASAKCGKGKVVSCGYQLAGQTAGFGSVIVEFVGTNFARSACFAGLWRTSDSNFGVQIQATAVCLVV
jgi:hypothetical protein